VLTYGSAVPTGIFLFAIITGSAVGQIYTNIRLNLFGLSDSSNTSLPLIIGAACMITSTTRLSYSIVVLMLEASSAFSIAIPMIIAVFTSKMIADLFTISLYDREIRDANIPLLTGSCPK